MKTQEKKQIAFIFIASVVVLALGVGLNYSKKTKSTETIGTNAAVEIKATSAPSPKPTPTVNPAEGIYTYLQGPKAWKNRMNWSGEWGNEFYDGGSFGGFGCGLCCMANIYSSLTKYRCSPVDMYNYAKKASMYGGGGAIDWGFIKETLTSAGFACDVWRKPHKYKKFQEQMKSAKACIIVVTSSEDGSFWKETPGHYVTLFLYNEKTDEVFLADSGDYKHNRRYVPLKKMYDSLKTSNRWHYLLVTDYNSKSDKWKNNKITGNCILPQYSD